MKPEEQVDCVLNLQAGENRGRQGFATRNPIQHPRAQQMPNRNIIGQDDSK